MKIITIARGAVNLPALTEQLQTDLGSTFVGVSTRPGAVVVFLTEDAPARSLTAATTLVADHDPSVLTNAQQTRRARLAALQAARTDYDEIISLNDFPITNLLVRRLAQTVYRLGLEVEALRDQIS